jgi:phosphoribosylglycinamide formyltransferase 1
MMKRIGILISGRGSNMLAIAAAIRNGSLTDAGISLVISNVRDAPGLAGAGEMGLETAVFDHRGHTREEHDRRMAAALHDRNVDIVCLAGYMRLLSPWLIREFPGQIINIHPSLLPAFTGLDAQRQALEHGVKHTGCSVHFVDEQLDHGPIIGQTVVSVAPDDTVESLSERILEAEHSLYPRCLQLVVSGKYRIEGRRVVELEDVGTGKVPGGW